MLRSVTPAPHEFADRAFCSCVLTTICASYIWWRQSPSCDSTTPRSSALAADYKGRASRLGRLPPGVQGSPQPGTISTNCASQFRLFLTFLFLRSAAGGDWSYPGQGYNSAAADFVWLVRSPGTVSHWTLVPHLLYQLSKTCSTHIFSHVLTSVTNCFVEYEQRTLYDALVSDFSHVTASYKLSFYCYFLFNHTSLHCYGTV